MTKKKFDCVEMKNKIQDFYYRKSKGDPKKLSQIIRETAHKSDLMAAFEKSNK